VYNPTNNHVSNNLITDVHTAIEEATAGVNNYPNNTIIGGTTAFSGMNTGASGSYFDGSVIRTIVNGVAVSQDGTYTPTLTNTTNVSSSTPYVAQYSRIGKTVNVSGKVDITCTANSAVTELRLSLPPGLTTTFTAEEQLAGQANPGEVTGAAAGPAYCKATAAGSTCRLRYTSGTSATSSRSWFFDFTYRIQ
jgi:hypothetical protein